MGKPKKMRNMLRILKDKLSLLKATLSLSSKPTTSFHVAVLRATTLHHPIEPPPMAAILSLTENHRTSTGIFLHVLLNRLNGTHSAYVALKCLLTFHYVITNAPPSIKEQISGYSCGPLFNVENFIDECDRDTCQLSIWVRWYADVLDYWVSLTRVGRENNFNRLSLLVCMVEKICGAPDSLHYQKLSLIYEVIKLVGEDYRIIMREISAKLNYYGKKRIEELNDENLEKFLSDLKRIENCKERIFFLFLNKKRNDGIWELIEEVRKDVEEVKERRENMRLVSFQGTELTRVVDNRVNELKSVTVVNGPRVKRWLDVEWNPLVASLA